MSPDPIRPLTPTERLVAREAATGADYATIGIRLGMAESTAAGHIHRIALKLPNPDELKPQILVALWSAHQLWLLQRDSAA